MCESVDGGHGLHRVTKSIRLRFEESKKRKNDMHNMQRTCLVFRSCSKTFFFYLPLCSFPASRGLDVMFPLSALMHILVCANFQLQNRPQQHTCFSNDIRDVNSFPPISLEERVLIYHNKCFVQSLQLQHCVGTKIYAEVRSFFWRYYLPPALVELINVEYSAKL